MNADLIIRVLSEKVETLEKTQQILVAIITQVKVGALSIDRVEVAEGNIRVLPDIKALPDRADSEAVS